MWTKPASGSPIACRGTACKWPRCLHTSAGSELRRGGGHGDPYMVGFMSLVTSGGVLSAAKGCGLPALESHPAGLGPVCGRHDADARQYYPRGGVGRAEPVLSYEVKVSMKTRDPTSARSMVWSRPVVEGPPPSAIEVAPPE
jgi:hypothetical protein